MLYDPTRLITLNGAANFRDVGGLATADGYLLRQGLIYRSDELSRLSAADLARIDQLGLRLVCDLRTARERRSRVSRLVASTSTRVVHIPFYHQSQEQSRVQLLWMLSRSARLDVSGLLNEFYHVIVFERSAEIGQLLTLIALPDNLPALIHCSGGKDRTGIVAALIQLLAGVPRAAVLDDYLLTNRLLAGRVQEFMRYLRWATLFQVSPQSIRQLLEVRPEYLAGVLDAIDARYGSVEAYLHNACGLSAAQIAQLRHALREERP